MSSVTNKGKCRERLLNRQRGIAISHFDQAFFNQPAGSMKHIALVDLGEPSYFVRNPERAGNQ